MDGGSVVRFLIFWLGWNYVLYPMFQEQQIISWNSNRASSEFFEMRRKEFQMKWKQTPSHLSSQKEMAIEMSVTHFTFFWYYQVSYVGLE